MGLRLRVVIPLACVLIAYGGLHAYLTATSQRTEAQSEAELSTLRLANTIRRSTRHAMLQSHREDVHKMIEDIGQQEGIEHVRILNKEGAIMYSSDKGEINRVVDRRAEACYQCHDAQQPLMKLETSQRTRVYRTPQGHRALAAIEVIYNEPSCWSAACHAHPRTRNLLGVVDVGLSLKEADQRVARATTEAVLIGFLSTVAICVLIGFLVDRLVNRPVQRLLECTHKVAHGDLNCTLLDMRHDEIGVLARSFRDMTEELGKARAELSDWAHKLEEEVAIKTNELKVAQAQILWSEKLSSIGLLAAGVAHELNNPLTGVLTFAHLAAKRLPDDSAEKKHLEVIVGQANRCAGIIRQLLDFSRDRPPEKKRQDVHALLDQAIALVEHRSDFQNIRIERDFAIILPQVMMDAGKMQQVFLNLLVNAGEAMPNGGHLTIQTQTALPAAGAGASREVRIVFRDTGVGIPSENIGKVFDPFFTSKEVGKGTGLGLAVSYGIVERHGGTISVESTPGKGTAFSITLPIAGTNGETA
jgi:two-component system NtrC family sensor kinase